MGELERLDEALGHFLAREPEVPFDLHDSLRTIIAAARSYRDVLMRVPKEEKCENPECENGFVFDGFDGMHNKWIECPDHPKEKCDGSTTCAASEHIHGCYRSKRRTHHV